MSADSKVEQQQAQDKTTTRVNRRTRVVSRERENPVLTPAEARIVGQLKGVLGERGLENSLGVLLAEVNKTISAIPSAQATPVDQETIDYLIAHSGVPGAERLNDWDSVAADERRVKAAAATAAQLETAMLGRDEVADLLKVDRTRISHMVRDGKVYAVKRGARPRYPKWQFHQRQTLPGLSEVIDTIDRADLHPLDLAAFMESPTPALGGRSPIDHLRSEGDPTAVAALLDAVVRQ